MLNHKTYDPHTTSTFKSLSISISKQGLDTMQKVDGLTYKQFSDKIVKKARELGESKLDPKKYTKLFSVVAFVR